METTTAPEIAPRPNATGTTLCVAMLLIMSLNLPGQTAVAVASRAAWGVGFALFLTFAADARGGVRHMVRADIFSLLALYFLTFFEFLFPQPDFNMMVNAADTRAACIAVMIGMGGLAIGRHFANLRAHPFREIFTRPVPNSWMFWAFWACAALGFAHMLFAVNFNVVEMVEHFMGPRFSQPWQRGRFGDWKALLVELALFLYLMPPIAGVMLARRKKYSKFQLLLCLSGFLFLLFYGFTSGTRNLFISFLVTFLIAYAFAAPPERKKELIFIALLSVILLGFSTVFMLRFRNIGLTNYLEGGYAKEVDPDEALFVDLNLYAMTQIMEVFPKRHSYLGLEVPYLAVIRPIPRAMWPGKPEGLSSTIEDALGVEGMTISATFVGEAYMSGGLIVVLVSGLFFGYIAGWWSQLASPKNSDLGILIYASGFFAAVITMRSMFVFTTALLPTVCSVIAAAYLVRRLRPRRVMDYHTALAMDVPVVKRPNLQQFRR